jgi:hypothetical protein
MLNECDNQVIGYRWHLGNPIHYILVNIAPLPMTVIYIGLPPLPHTLSHEMRYHKESPFLNARTKQKIRNGENRRGGE